MNTPVITLLTDFGLRDHFVGVMKGVILGICPQAVIVDITHALAPQEIAEAAFILGCAYPHFPPGTVHVAVVDPGVGGERRALAARCGEHLFVAPDNGILSCAFAEQLHWKAVAITDPQSRLPEVSSTFHGRDIFAPAAARLAAGVELETLGPAIDDPVLLEMSSPRETPAGFEVHILHVDHFGNLISDLKRQRLAEWLGAAGFEGVMIEAGRASLQGVAACYEAAPRGRAVAVIGSAGRVEIAVNGGRADEVLGLGRGDSIWLRKAR